MGIVHDLSYRGHILVKASFAPSEGQEVRDARRRPLGRVKRVFGPVKAPYVTIEPREEPSLGLIGSDVCVEVEG